VLRILEQRRIAEAFGRRRIRAAEHARDQPRDRVDHDQRAELAAGQHVVADRDLFIEQRAHAFVDAFVTTAEQQHRFAGRREARRNGLRERRSLRSEQDAPLRREACRDVFDRRIDRLWTHHHSGTTAVRRIVDRMRAAAGVVAKLMRADGEQTGFCRTAEHAEARARLDEFGKQRQDVERDHRDSSSFFCGGAPYSSASAATVMRPAARSTSISAFAVAGIRISEPSAAATTYTSLAPVAITSTSRPRARLSCARTSRPTRSVSRYSPSRISPSALRSTTIVAPTSASAASRSATRSNVTRTPSFTWDALRTVVR